MSWEISGLETENNITFTVGHGFTRYIGFPITNELIEAVKTRSPKIFEILEAVTKDHEQIFDAHDLEGGDWFEPRYGPFSRISTEEEDQLRLKLEGILACKSSLIGPEEREVAQYGLSQLDARVGARKQAEAKKYYTIQRRKEFNKNRDSLMLAVIKRDGYACAECGSAEDLTLDHKHPLSEGGTDDLENLRILCRSHNSQKGNRIVTPES